MLDRYQSEIQSKEIPEGIQDDREEMLNKCKSDLARSWGKYCLLLLQRSMDKDIADRSVTILFIRVRWAVKCLTIGLMNSDNIDLILGVKIDSENPIL